MIFIKFSSIKDQRTIDVRTKSEFQKMKLFQYNLPIINEKQHDLIKQFYPCALIVIIRSLYLKRRNFKSELLRISENGSIPLIIGCSRGRLRSPIVYLFAKLIGIKDCKILFGGIKPLFLNNAKKKR